MYFKLDSFQNSVELIGSIKELSVVSFYMELIQVENYLPYTSLNYY